MSAYRNLQKAQQKNRSMICLGLDLDPKKMPAELGNSIKGMFDFAHRIIDATSDSVCAYKPNMAFFESLGPEGLSLLKLVRDRIPEDIPVIMDGKRGDIGNTAQHYADSLYNTYRADWVTLSPYMGHDSLRPFLEFKDKGSFILCLTSNSGSKDFQQLDISGKPLYQIVAEKVLYWNKDQNCGLVVGATHPDQLKELRAVSGDMPLLIPGVGAQGGSLEEAAVLGSGNFQKLAVINVSRSVLYASNEKDFALRARAELDKLNQQVSALRAAAFQGRPPAQPEQTGDQPGIPASAENQQTSQPEANQPADTNQTRQNG